MQEVRVPSLEELQQVLQQLTLQRAAYKDQVEAIEKQMTVINAQVQLLQAQAAKAAEGPEVTED